VAEGEMHRLRLVDGKTGVVEKVVNTSMPVDYEFGQNRDQVC
jgi:hypothetical protein